MLFPMLYSEYRAQCGFLSSCSVGTLRSGRYKIALPLCLKMNLRELKGISPHSQRAFGDGGHIHDNVKTKRDFTTFTTSFWSQIKRPGTAVLLMLHLLQKEQVFHHKYLQSPHANAALTSALIPNHGLEEKHTEQATNIQTRTHLMKWKGNAILCSETYV